MHNVSISSLIVFNKLIMSYLSLISLKGKEVFSLEKKKIFMSATATAFIASAFALPGASDATSLSDKTAEGTWTASVKHDLKVKHIDADEVIKKRTALASKNKADKKTKEQVEKNKISVDDIDDSGTYTVKSGDTLSEIAYEFDISTEDLMEWNDLDSTIIVPGQKLIVVEDAKVEQLNNRETEEVKEKPTPVVTEEKVAQPKVVVKKDSKAETNAEREAQAEAERQAEEQAKAEEEAARQAEEDAKAQKEAERAAEEQAQAEEQAKAEEEAAREAEKAAEAEEEAQAQEEAQAEADQEAERQAEEDDQAEEQAETDQVAEEEAQVEQEAETEVDHQAEEETQIQEEPQTEQETETEQEVEVEEVEQPADEPQQNNTTTTGNAENNNEQAQAQQAEQERQAEAERKAKQEQERKAEEERKAKAEQERKAEEERKAKEERERKAEEERKAKEEAKKAEEEKEQTHAQGINGDLIGAAPSAMGTPYVWGGAQPGGFDCSGFIYWAHKESGNDVGRTSTDGYYNKSYMVDSPQVGDLVFFEGTYRQGISHMGIYVGGGQFIHASTSARVTISSVNGTY